MVEDANKRAPVGNQNWRRNENTRSLPRVCESKSKSGWAREHDLRRMRQEVVHELVRASLLVAAIKSRNRYFTAVALFEVQRREWRPTSWCVGCSDNTAAGRTS